MTPRKQVRDPSGRESIRAGAGWLHRGYWAQARRALVTGILRRKTSRIEVIDVEGMVMGWVCWEWGPEPRTVLIHFAYVVPAARREGIGRQLVQPLLSSKYVPTHMTRDGAALLARDLERLGWGAAGKAQK